jgi:Reverse transcriptase (RNA-dependent DNA polymerase)
VYVDDIVIASTDEKEAEALVREIAERFEIKDNGSCDEILGIGIHIDREKKTLELDQSAHIETFLQDHIQDSRRRCAIPMSVNITVLALEERFVLDMIYYKSDKRGKSFIYRGHRRLCTPPNPCLFVVTPD